jgi:hypothetical protein
MAYPFDAPSESQQDYWIEGNYTPENVVAYVKDNYTAVNKNSLRNSVGSEISKIQNFVNSYYLGRTDSPVVSGYITNLYSTSASGYMYNTKYISKGIKYTSTTTGILGETATNGAVFITMSGDGIVIRRSSATAVGATVNLEAVYNTNITLAKFGKIDDATGEVLYGLNIPSGAYLAIGSLQSETGVDDPEIPRIWGGVHDDLPANTYPKINIGLPIPINFSPYHSHCDVNLLSRGGEILLNSCYIEAGLAGTITCKGYYVNISGYSLRLNNSYMGFYSHTPIVQPSSSGEMSGFDTGTGSGVNSGSTFTGNVGSTTYTIGDIVKHLKNLGLIAD